MCNNYELETKEHILYKCARHSACRLHITNGISFSSIVNNRGRASEINIQEFRQKSTQNILYKQCRKQEPSASTNKIKNNQHIGVENTEIRSRQEINILIVIIIVFVIVVTVIKKVLRNIGTKIIIITDGWKIIIIMYSWKIEERENAQNTFSMRR